MDSASATRAAAMFESILLAPLLRPLVAGAGFAGDYEVSLLAGEIADRDASGFASALARQLDMSP